MLSFPHPTGRVLQVTDEILRQGKSASRDSERGRIIYPLHRADKAPVQRMLNFFQPRTYVTPHRHVMYGATETITVLSGKLGFIAFDAQGEITDTFTLSACGVIDIEPNLWHSMIALEEDTVLLEIKKGPYQSRYDKDFAVWAPKELTEESAKMLQIWRGLF